MLGADVGQISSGILDDGRSHDSGLDFLDYLLPKFTHQAPWRHHQKTPMEDFIMIAEFSEQEGPRPVILIPKDGGKYIDQNELSVKILAVDHQSSIVEGCHMTEDAQVVMADSDHNAHSFIHHIVLNDIQARGYVRPFCITYVTTDPMKIMKCYDLLATQLKEVARLMKFGNRLVFMRDLEKRLEDLDFTKTQLLISQNQNRSQTSTQGDNELLNTLNIIRQSMEEAKDIMANLKTQLMDKELEERFHAYEKRLKSSQHPSPEGSDTGSLKDFSCSGPSTDLELSGSYTCSPEFSLFIKSRDLKPKLLDVSIIGGKRRFDRSLRGLHELCSWGAKEGLQKLRIVRESLRRDLSTIVLEDMDLSIMSPDSGVLSFGCYSIGANFLSACDSTKDACCLKRQMCHKGPQYDHLSTFGSVDSFQSLPSSFQSFLEDDTMYSVESSLKEAESAVAYLDRQTSFNALDEYFNFEYDNEFPEKKTERTSIDASGSLSETLTGDVRTTDKGQTSRKDSKCSDSSDYDSISIDKDLHCVARGCVCEEKGRKHEKKDSKNVEVKLGAKDIQCCDKNTEKKNDSYHCGNGAIKTIDYKCNIKTDDDKGEVGAISCVQICESCSEDNTTLEKGFDIVDMDKVSDDSAHTESNIPDVFVGFTDSTSTLTNSINEMSGIDLAHSKDDADNDDKPVEERSKRPEHDNKKTCDTNTVIDKDAEAINISKDESNKVQSAYEIHRHLEPSCSHPTLSNKLPEEETDSSDKESEATSTEIEATDISDKESESTDMSNNDSSEARKSYDSNIVKSKSNEYDSSTNEVNIKKSVNVINRDRSSLSESLTSGYSAKTGVYNRDRDRLSESSASTYHSAKTGAVVGDTDTHRHSISGSLPESENSSELRLMYSKHGSPSSLSQSSHRYRQGLDTEEHGHRQRSLARRRLKWNVHGFPMEANEYTIRCLLKALATYNNLQNVIYSLLSGKPVVVIATEKHEASLKDFLKALSVFTPVLPSGISISLMCQIKQLKVSEVRRSQVRGMLRSERRAVDFLVPNSVRRYITLVDMDKSLIHCQPYQGTCLNFISNIYSKKLTFKSDQALFHFIQMQLLDISTKALGFYHSISSADRDTDLSGTTLPRKSSMLELSAEKYMCRGGHLSSDCRIIKYLAEIVKTQQIEEEFKAKFLTDAPVYPFKVVYQSLQTYRM